MTRRLQRLKEINLSSFGTAVTVLAMCYQFILIDSYWSPVVKAILIYLYTWLQPYILIYLSASKNIKVYGKVLPAYSIVTTIILVIGVCGGFRHEALAMLLMSFPYVLYLSVAILTETNIETNEERKTAIYTIMFAEDLTKIVYILFSMLVVVYFTNWSLLLHICVLTIIMFAICWAVFARKVKAIYKNTKVLDNEQA